MLNNNFLENILNILRKLLNFSFKLPANFFEI